MTYTFPSGRQAKRSVFRFVFAEVSFLNSALMVCCFCGMLVNFMTAFAWGLGKNWFKKYGGDDWSAIPKDRADNITLCYDLSKGLLQFVFGFYADRIGYKKLIVSGLSVMSIGLFTWAITGASTGSEGGFALAALLLGLGTSMMYSPIIACVATLADPSWRSSAVGSYRFWRDTGYAIGGLATAGIADSTSIATAVFVTACLPIVGATLFFFFGKDHYEGEMDMPAIQIGVDKLKVGAKWTCPPSRSAWTSSK